MNPSLLRQVILAQAHEPGGAVVVLYTSATLTHPGDGPTGEEAGAAEVVAQTASELNLDTDPLASFSVDAYLLQSALGERLLPGEA